MNWPSYPKILQLGHAKISHIFSNTVEVTEKIDGSQFSFAKDEDGRLWCRSKGAYINTDAPPKMFAPAVDYLKSILNEKYAPRIPDNVIFYGETLCKPKHNVLQYDHVPRNHIVLFGALNMWDHTTGWATRWHILNTYASILGIDVVPEIPYVMHTDVRLLLNRESFLGGANIEGVVVKNYSEVVVLTPDVILPFAAGKYVSERFKEKHSSKAYGCKEQNENLESFFKSFKTEARWQKAVQHLRDQGVLELDPRSIGALIKELERDLIEEHQDEIKNRLWKEYRRQIVGTVTKGFPEWFKDRLLEGAFN